MASWRFFERRKPLAPDFSITAIISVYDDEVYLSRCFKNMEDCGVEAIVVDNDCLPGTREIVEANVGGVVREVVRHPREGTFDWSGILRHKEEIANSRNSDWMMLWDTDEFRQAPDGADDFRTAIRAADEAGYTTVNFDEFVFVPVTESEEHRGTDYVAGLETYYYFAPRPQHRANAWRKPGGNVALMKGAGHTVAFGGQRVSPDHFAMRHFLFLSHAHGMQKYLGRSYSDEDQTKGWSSERRNTTVETFRLPDPTTMKRKSAGVAWDRSDRRAQHPTFIYTAMDGIEGT